MTLGELERPRLGLGLAAIGRPGYITLGRDRDLGAARDVDEMQARAHALLDAAWAAGVRDFDVARSYGRAEAFLASWLAARALEPGAVRVSSKWGYTYVADWKVEAAQHEVKDHRLPVLERQWPESQDHLGAHLGLYQIHSATLETGVLEDLDVLRRLAALREAAGVRIGLSSSGPRQAETLRRALDVRLDGAPVFDAVQATWNLLEPSAGAALQAAHDAGLTVIVKEGVANGRLTDAGLETLPGPEPLQARAEAHRVGVDAFALAAILARPWVDVVLSGAVTEAQLQSNLAAADIEWSAEDEAALTEGALPAEQYWRERADLPWS